MTPLQELKREARMTLFRRFREDGQAAYVVRGPARQEKVFADKTDAETYYRYYVARCRREEPAAPVD
jgi:hypothetical protein